MQSVLFGIANSIMSLGARLGLLGAEISDTELLAEYPWLDNVINPILGILDALLVPILIIVGTAGSIYAIVLGVNYSRAETADKRDEAKKRMINAIVGIVVMIFLLVVLQLFTSNATTIVSWITGFGEETPTDTGMAILRLLTK